MPPTYHVKEIAGLVPLLDINTLVVLRELVEEENNRYSVDDLMNIYELLLLRVKDLKKYND